MKIEKKYILSLLNIGVVLLFVSAFFIRCASIMTPEGGPKDTIPPVIVNMVPDNFTTNFTAKKIYIEFDEFVQLKDQQKEFFTSPQMKTKPKLTIRGRGVVVTLGDSLVPNTTYALNFGSSIQDNNESNPLYSMRYVFSTGDEIDSMIMSGYVEDSFKSDSVSGAVLYFFPADSVEYNKDYDSTMFNYTPTIIARAENNGIFLAQNLKPINYRVYAFEDRNNNFIYEPETDQIGFIDSVYNPARMPDFSLWFDSIRKYAVAEPQLHFKLFEDKAFKRQNLSEYTRPNQHKALLYFNTSFPQVESIVFDSLSQEQFIVEPLTKGKDTLAIWFNAEAKMLPDTIRGSVNYYKHDSIRNLTLTSDPIRLTWRFIESKEEQKEREKQERAKEKAIADGEEWVEPEVENPFKMTTTTPGAVNPLNPLTMSFDYPLTRVDTTAISLRYFSTDSTSVREPFTLERDSVNFRLWRINSSLEKIEGKYRLTINRGALHNVAQQSNDSLSVDYTVFKKENFSTVSIKFTKDSNDPAHYIIEMLDGSNKKIDSAIATKSEEIIFYYVPAGDIRFRLIQDTNRDGERSSGNLISRLSPERVAHYEKDGNTTFQTKVNWDFSFDIDAPTLFAEESMDSLIKRLEKEEIQRLNKEIKDHATEFLNNLQQNGGHDHDHNH